MILSKIKFILQTQCTGQLNCYYLYKPNSAKLKIVKIIYFSHLVNLVAGCSGKDMHNSPLVFHLGKKEGHVVTVLKPLLPQC